jgi:hypothetical protein
VTEDLVAIRNVHEKPVIRGPRQGEVLPWITTGAGNEARALVTHRLIAEEFLVPMVGEIAKPPDDFPTERWPEPDDFERLLARARRVRGRP